MSIRKKRVLEFASTGAEAEQAKKLAKELEAALPDSAKYLVKDLVACYRALEDFNLTLWQIDMTGDSPPAQGSKFLMDEVMDFGDQLIERYGLEPVARWEQPA